MRYYYTPYVQSPPFQLPMVPPHSLTNQQKRKQEAQQDDDKIGKVSKREKRDIQKAINDEYTAIQYYTRLAQLAPIDKAKEEILGIRQDEIRHFYQFTKSFYQLSGKYPKLNIFNQQFPNSYRQGLRESIRDETETAPFYFSIASRTNDLRIKRRFTQAAFDEQRHAQILQRLLEELK
jgi:rubrerythrin